MFGLESTSSGAWTTTAWPLVVQLAFDATVVLSTAGLVSLAMRRASAALRHGVWTVAVVGLLALPLLRMALPGVPLGRLIPERTTVDAPPVARADPAADQAAAHASSTAPVASPDFQQHVADPYPRRDEAIPSRAIRGADGAETTPAAAVPETTTAVETETASGQQKTSFGRWLARLLPWPALLVGLWSVGTVWRLFAFLGTLIRTEWLLHQAGGIDDPQWRRRTAEMAGRLGLRRPVALLLSDKTTIPSTAGWFRPRVILPPEYVQWSDEVRRVVLAHELTHVARRDVLWQTLAHWAAVFYWFHPLVWLAARRLRWEREVACDDAVLRLGEKPSSYARHLLGFAAAVAGRSQLLGAAVAMATRRPIETRIRKVLHPSLSRAPISLRAGCVLVAVTSLLLLAVGAIRAVDAPTEPLGEPAETAEAGQSDSRKETKVTEPPSATKESGKNDANQRQPKNDTMAASPFELTVAGAGREPVPGARVEVRMRPGPKRWTVHCGSFIKKLRYGTLLKADGDGRLVFELPKRRPRYLVLNITTDGYGPFWAKWDSTEHAEPIPDAYTARLDAGQSVGGIIVDEQGKPVKGARVHPSIEFKRREGDLESIHVGARLKTDAQGKWSYHSVPASMQTLSLEIMHSRYMPQRTSILTKEFSLEDGKSPTAKIVLRRGIAVTGKVTDEAGRPIAGARVRTKFLNDQRKAKTDQDGVYRLLGCEPVRTDLVVTAKGRAPELKNVKIEPDMPPVDFQLPPGRTIRVRVTDSNGNPIPRTRIFFQSWRGARCDYELDFIHHYTDKNGLWAWNEAPADAVVCDICPPGGMTLARQTLVAREEEYVFTPPPLLVISGRVVDAKTKKPIGRFRVVPGYWSSEEHMNWARGSSFEAKKGTYRIKLRHPGHFAHQVRIEAAGYLPAVSRQIKSHEGSIAIDFSLEPAEDVAATVLSPDGNPAEDAKIAMGVARAQINVHDGHFQDHSTYCDRRTTDEHGHFAFPPQGTPYQLVITHPTGYAHVKAEPADRLETIRLRPWARVEGTYRIGAKPAAGKPITMDDTGVSYGKDVPNIWLSNTAVTDKHGRFVFPRVAPGKWSIGRRILLTVTQGAREAVSSRRRRIEVSAGQTARVDLGGSGRAVVGKLLPPEGLEAEVDWNFGLLHVVPKLPSPPPAPVPEAVKGNPGARKAWWAEWSITDEGKAWQKLHDQDEADRAALGRFTATIRRDGTFRVDDVPADDYELTVRLDTAPESRRGGPGPLLEMLRRALSVPEMPDGRSDKPLDLGTLKLNGRSPTGGVGNGATEAKDQDVPLEPATMALAATPANLVAVAGKAETKPVKKSARPAPQAPDAAKKARRSLLLTILDEEDRPVAGAKVTVRTTLVVGRRCKATRHRSDKSGRLELDVPEKTPRIYSIYVESPGHVPYLGKWEQRGTPDPIPEAYTIRLAAGRLIGGIVRNEKGEPVEGVQVRPSFNLKLRSERTGYPLGANVAVKTDAGGRWTYPSFPADRSQLRVVLRHRGYADTRVTGPVSKFTISEGEAPSSVLIIQRGATITGKVTDEDGRPIAGAVVYNHHYLGHGIPAAKTDRSGEYRFTNVCPGDGCLTASAKGWAPSLVTARIEPPADGEPRPRRIDFKLSRGRPLSVRLIDSDGKPIAGARVWLQTWEKQRIISGLPERRGQTGADGVWRWPHAPRGQLSFCVLKNGYALLTNQRLEAGQPEKVLTMRPAETTPMLSISGRVVDAQTKRPIKRFHVVPGRRPVPSGSIYWMYSSRSEGHDGTYRRDFRPGDPWLRKKTCMIRIEAAGYRPAASRVLEVDERDVTLDFELEKAPDVKVLTPQGQAAGGATVAVCGQYNKPTIENGVISEGSACQRVTVDAQGRCQIAPQDVSALLVVHESGVAYVTAQLRHSTTIRLAPWPRVEGTVLLRNKPAADQVVSLEQLPEANHLRFYQYLQTTSDRNGRFTFEKVMPGAKRITRYVVGKHGKVPSRTPTHSIRTECVAGQTARVELKRDGRPVTGKLRMPDGVDLVPEWHLASIELRGPDLPLLKIPWPKGLDPEKDGPSAAKWFKQWRETAAGKRFQEDMKRYNQMARKMGPIYVKPEADGSFTFDDVPAGRYRLLVRLKSPPAERQTEPGSTIARLMHSFTVPKMPGGHSDEPLDLGTLPIGKPDDDGTADESTTTAPVTKEKKGERSLKAGAKPKQSLTLHVVDEQGEPLGRAWALLRVGKRRTRHKADASGRVTFDVPLDQWFSVFVHAKGLVSMFGAWEPAKDVPPAGQYKIMLGRPTTIGGLVRDEQGRPVKGAQISISTGLPIREEMYFGPSFGGKVKTDAQGRWRFGGMPNQFISDSCYIALSHPDYVRSMHRHYEPRPSAEGLRKLTSVMILKKGLTVEGVVTDLKGRPIVGARVARGERFGHVPVAVNIRRSDKQGRYRFDNCRLGPLTLTVVAPGHAPELRQTTVTKDMAPVDFRLKPGRTLRLRVVDQHGKPIIKARVCPDTWCGCRTLYGMGISGNTDDQGRWVWDGAPDDEVIYDSHHRDYMSCRDLPLVAGPREQTIVLHPKLVISGRVFDEKTGKPIPSFRVLPGVDRWQEGDYHTYWQRDYEAASGKRGRYKITIDEPAEKRLIRIEAPGYRPAVSRAIANDEGNVTLDFKLHPAKCPTGIVEGPDGKPLAKAEVFLCTPSRRPYVTNGRVRASQRSVPWTQTDAEGRFALPATDEPFMLLVLHGAGHAEVSEVEIEASSTIRVNRWARLEGTAKIGSKPAANASLSLNFERLLGRRKDQPHVFYDYRSQADGQGRFVFERAVPEPAFVARTKRFAERPSGGYAQLSACRLPVVLRPGKTTRVTLGGTGRPVVGRVVLPDDMDHDVDFNFASGEITRSARVELPPVDEPEGFEEMSPAEQQRIVAAFVKERHHREQASRISYGFTINRDGTFCCDDVSAGEYRLTIRLQEAPLPGAFGPRATIGMYQQAVLVPEMAGGRNDEPLDLGTLELIPTSARKPGITQRLISLIGGKKSEKDTSAAATANKRATEEKAR